MPEGFCSALALLDLVKAYELVPHHRILDGAVAFNFPLVILRVLFCVFSLPRRICIQGCLSSFDVGAVFSTIIAGSVFGPCLLRMSMQRALDVWHAEWPMMQLYLYIDDMGVLSQGTEHVVVKYLAASIARLIEIVSSVDAYFSLGSPGVPGGKSVVVSPPALFQQLFLQFSKLGIAVVDHARNLGIDIFFTPQSPQ